MAAKLAVITDSSCSLPSKLVEKYRIKQLPLKIIIDGKMHPDPCDASKTLALFKSGMLSKKHEVTTEPPTPEEFEQAIREAVESECKNIVIQTVNRTQGETYNNANIAASNMRRELNNGRHDFTIRVMDSRTVFAGQAVMISETIRRILAGQNANEVRRSMDHLSENIHTYILPRDPLLALKRAQKRNENAVGWGKVFIASALGIYPVLCNVNDSSYLAAKVRGFENTVEQLFNHACVQIENKLLIPLVGINYGGSMQELQELPGYQKLKEVAQKHKVQIIPSVMSIAGGIYTSVGSLSLAVACEPGEWSGG
ncbi:DegV family protein [Agarilytica rhodophyticola]|uniref:DegV family protein n=1 Tax=Agarilytica rhodophyticola TaxID=1737490 RepID=UPI000B346F33|nr:DegV family protein [Agarilytica rhodophyticola]